MSLSETWNLLQIPIFESIASFKPHNNLEAGYTNFWEFFQIIRAILTKNS